MRAYAYKHKHGHGHFGAVGAVVTVGAVVRRNADHSVSDGSGRRTRGEEMQGNSDARAAGKKRGEERRGRHLTRAWCIMAIMVIVVVVMAFPARTQAHCAAKRLGGMVVRRSNGLFLPSASRARHGFLILCAVRGRGRLY